MSTNTPKTDAETRHCWTHRDGKYVPCGNMVDYRFARQLERELAEAREEIGQLKSQLTKTHGCVTISRNGYVQEVEQQRDKLAEELDSWKESVLNLSHPNMKLILKDIAEVRDQLDRLAEASLRLADIAEKNTDDTDLWETIIADVRSLAAKGGSYE